MDENKEVNSTDPKREKVRVIPLSAIDDAPDHPFGVRDDEEMEELVESISTFGVINPVIVRKGEGERYELISGHRRKYACAKLGIDTLPVIVRDLSREEAIIFMVDSNLQREHILPSERAKAYKMKLDAIKRQGSRTDLTSRPLGEKLLSVDEIANSTDDSARQIHRYKVCERTCREIGPDIGEERQGTHMKNNYESVYRMKLTGYQVRTAIGILNERRLALKSQGCTLENSEEYVGVFNLLSRFLDLLPA